MKLTRVNQFREEERIHWNPAILSVKYPLTCPTEIANRQLDLWSGMRVPYVRLNLSIGKDDVTQEEFSSPRKYLCPLSFLSPVHSNSLLLLMCHGTRACACACVPACWGWGCSLASACYTDPLTASLESPQSCLSLPLLFWSSLCFPCESSIISQRFRVPQIP